MNVIILGMHRSGTSAVAHALHRLGLYVARDDNLMPRREDNPDGYWERMDVYRLNDRLLAQLGCSWDQIADIDCTDLAPDARADALGRIDAILGELGNEAPWLLKDPRLSALLPIWRSQLGADVKTLIMWRNPLEVAESLQRRDGMPLAHGVALWEAYSVAALDSTAGMDRRLLPYDRLLEEPAEVLEELRQWLELPAESLDDAVSTIRKRLRHQNVDPQELAPFLNPQRTELLQRLESGNALDAETTDVSVDSLSLLRGLRSQRRAAAVTGPSPSGNGALEDRLAVIEARLQEATLGLEAQARAQADLANRLAATDERSLTLEQRLVERYRARLLRAEELAAAHAVSLHDAENRARMAEERVAAVEAEAIEASASSAARIEDAERRARDAEEEREAAAARERLGEERLRSLEDRLTALEVEERRLIAELEGAHERLAEVGEEAERLQGYLVTTTEALDRLQSTRTYRAMRTFNRLLGRTDSSS